MRRMRLAGACILLVALVLAPVARAADAPKLRKGLTSAKVVDVVLLSGGDPPRSDPCEAMSQHGFLGIEGQAVDAIAKFVTANSR